MELRKDRVRRGPNVWSRQPVIEAWVDLGGLDSLQSGLIPGFEERLTARLPSLHDRFRAARIEDGTAGPTRGGTNLAHILGKTALELQDLAGTTADFCRVRA